MGTERPRARGEANRAGTACCFRWLLSLAAFVGLRHAHAPPTGRLRVLGTCGEASKAGLTVIRRPLLTCWARRMKREMLRLPLKSGAPCLATCQFHGTYVWIEFRPSGGQHARVSTRQHVVGVWPGSFETLRGASPHPPRAHSVRGCAGAATHTAVARLPFRCGHGAGEAVRGEATCPWRGGAGGGRASTRAGRGCSGSHPPPAARGPHTADTQSAHGQHTVSTRPRRNGKDQM